MCKNLLIFPVCLCINFYSTSSGYLLILNYDLCVDLNHVECHESLRNVIHVQGYPENFDADDVLRVFQKYDSQARIHDP